MDAAPGAAGRSQLPGWVRGGLTGGFAAVKGILYRDINNTPLPGSRGKVRWREERRKRERLEDSLLLLRQHHDETLQQLHSQAERLQRENRELNFRLIMCRCGERSTSTSSPDPSSGQMTERLLVLEREVHQLRQALADERHRNGRILQMFQSQLESEETEGAPSQETILRENDTESHQIEKGHQVAPTTCLEVKPNHSYSGETGNEYIKLPALRPRLPGGVAERQRRRQAVQKRASQCRLPPLHQPLT